jgi:hypothetical protein
MQQHNLITEPITETKQKVCSTWNEMAYVANGKVEKSLNT